MNKCNFECKYKDENSRCKVYPNEYCCSRYRCLCRGECVICKHKNDCIEKGLA